MTNAENSEQSEFWNQQGCTLCVAEQYTAAIAAFDRAIVLCPTDSHAWNNRGNALCAINRRAEALAAYDRAIAIQPMNHRAWFNRGLLLTEMRAYGTALESYARAVSISRSQDAGEPDPRYVHAEAGIWMKEKLFAT